MKNTPKQQIAYLRNLENEKSFYSVENSFITIIEKRLENDSILIMKKIQNKLGTLFANERVVYNKIYEFLSEGKSEKYIVDYFKYSK